MNCLLDDAPLSPRKNQDRVGFLDQYDDEEEKPDSDERPRVELDEWGQYDVLVWVEDRESAPSVRVLALELEPETLDLVKPEVKAVLLLSLDLASRRRVCVSLMVTSNSYAYEAPRRRGSFSSSRSRHNSPW